MGIVIVPHLTSAVGRAKGVSSGRMLRRAPGTVKAHADFIFHILTLSSLAVNIDLVTTLVNLLLKLPDAK